MAFSVVSAQLHNESEVAKLAKSIGEGLNGPPKLIFVFASPALSLAKINTELAKHFESAVVAGCSSSGEFTERGAAKQSVSIVAISGDMRVAAGFAGDLKQSSVKAVQKALEPHPAKADGYPYRTSVILLDPLAGNGEEATLTAATMLGDDVTIVGGAAGDDLAMKQTHVALGSQSASDAIVILSLFTREPLGMGVAHGHVALSEPINVTRADGATIFELDGKPAWQVWREKTRQDAKARGVDVDNLAPDAVGPFLLTYEAGLPTGDELKIRAPLQVNGDGSINFACGVPTGSKIRISRSDADRQIASAQQAAKQAHESLDGRRIAGAVVFDCICRNLILGDRFTDAVRLISDELGGVPLGGFETYGEIGLNRGSLSGFHNTTTVVLAFPA
jgi:methyl-accepting chemotaxis protein